MPDILRNLNVHSCKLPFIRDTFGLSWIDAMHVDSLRCLGEVHMLGWLLGECINELVETHHISSCNTQGICWTDAIHALLFITMDASYMLSIHSSFLVGFSMSTRNFIDSGQNSAHQLLDNR